MAGVDPKLGGSMFQRENLAPQAPASLDAPKAKGLLARGIKKFHDLVRGVVLSGSAAISEANPQFSEPKGPNPISSPPYGEHGDKESPMTPLPVDNSAHQIPENITIPKMIPKNGISIERNESDTENDISDQNVYNI